MSNEIDIRKAISKQDLQNFPTGKFGGEIIVVDQLEQVSAAIAELSKEAFIGFDTESKPSFEKGKSNVNQVALMQLSSEHRAFLFRINIIGLPKELKALLENPKILKIGSAVHGDLDKIKVLDANKSYHPQGFVDIQIIAKRNGMASVGLKKLSAILLGFRMSKRHQLTNWETETLSFGQLNYAATDAWATFKVYQEFAKRKML